MTCLLPIVEGDGDLQAVPVLIRRLLQDVHHRFDIQLLPAQRRGEWPRVKREFERFYLSARLHNAPIFWILDFDCDDCVDVHLEERWLKKRAAELDPQGKIEVAFIVKEFESLFLYDEASTRGAFPELPLSIRFPTQPEAVRDAKGWLSGALPKGRAYKPTTDQARLTSRLDLHLLRHTSPSFQRFEQALLRLI